MKLFISILLFLINFNISTVFSQFTGDSWSSVKSAGNGELTCVYYQTPGLVFEENGKMQGVCIDIMNEFKSYVSDQYNVTLSFKFVKKVPVFTEFIKTVRNSDNIMGVCNTSITTDRMKYLDFSPAYMNNPSVLLSNHDAPVLRDLTNMSDNFNGYRAVIIKGSTHEKYLKKLSEHYYPNLSIDYAESGAEVNSKLRNDTKYFTLIDFTEYFDAVKRK